MPSLSLLTSAIVMVNGEPLLTYPGEPTPGQLAYEEDVRRSPSYPDGSPRKAWAALGDVERWSWERCPTPREYGSRADV